MPTAKMYLPRTADDYTAARGMIERTLARKFGGFTWYAAQGGWENDDGELISEPVAVFESVTGPTADAADMRDRLYGLARDVRDRTGESAVMFTVDGDRYMVTAE